MILASHGIFTAYGFWLPNDPRGSRSDFVRRWELRRFGAATKISTRHSVAGRPHNQKLRIAAKTSLMFPPICFNGLQSLTISKGFARAIEESGYRLLACAILPEHVHIVVERHELPVERIIGHLKTRATQQLVAEGMHPFVQFVHRGRFPSVWAHRAWKVFLNSDDEIERAIQYVERNPTKEGKKKQNWPFVTQFNDRQTTTAGRTSAAAKRR